MIENNNQLTKKKALIYGIDSLNEIELLSIIINTGIKNQSSFDIASNLLLKYKSLKDLFTSEIEELISNKGISKNKAILIKAIYSLYTKMDYYIPLKNIKITSGDDIYYHYYYLINKTNNEKLFCLYLNNLNEVIKDELVCTGSLENISFDQDQIIKNAFLLKSKKIILVHNHPHGNSSPSLSDLNTTNIIKERLEIFNIRLLDHVIIGFNEYYSIKDHLKVKK